MSTFRKKPVVIEAFQWTGNCNDAFPKWLTSAITYGDVWFICVAGADVLISIRTLEGVMTGKPGDWIIKGVKDELYPCREDIFTATYEPVKGATE